MTEAARQGAGRGGDPRARSQLSGLTVVTAAGALFCVLLIWLALQVRAGADPAIGAGTQAPVQQPRQIVVRRIVERRIVEEPAPAAGGAGGPAIAAGAGGPAPAAGPTPAAAAPAATDPAPAASAPPAPAPAPAPMVTRAS